MTTRTKNVQEKATEVEAATAEARPAAKPAGQDREARREVAALSPAMQELVNKLLVEGATFEDVVETVAEQGEDTITLRAVANHFHGNLELQKQRVRHQVDTANELKKSLGNPETAEGQLAEAAFLTGYLRLNRKSAELDLNRAEKSRLERENLRLKQWVWRLKGQKLLTDRSLNKARIRTELARGKILKEQWGQLHKMAQEAGDPREIGPQLVQKIQEIYGIATLPSLPAEIR